MKNLKILLLPVACLLMALNFVACDKDDDKGGPENPDKNLIGKWIGDFDGDDAMLEFKSDGKVFVTFDYNDGGYAWPTDYSVSGETLRIENLDDEYTLGTYSINKNVLTYTYRFYDYDDNEPTTQMRTDIFIKL